MGLGAVIPLVINSMFNSYPSEVADMNYEDFFTPWALSTGVPQHIRANREGLNNEHVSTRVVPLNEKLIGDALLQHITGMLIMIEELLADRL